MYMAWSDLIGAFCVAYNIVYGQLNPSNRDDMVHLSFWVSDRFSVWGRVSVLGWGRYQG